MTSRVQQLLSGAGPYDAVTNQALAWQRILAAAGHGGDVYAATFDPQLGDAVRPAETLAGRVRADDLIVIHYSAHAAALDEAAALPNRKLLVYHNITPARYLWDHEPYVAMLCALGRERLGRYAGRVDAAVAPSAFSALDLHEAGFAGVRVEPAIYLFERARLEPGAGTRRPGRAMGGARSSSSGACRTTSARTGSSRPSRCTSASATPNARLVLPGSPGSGTYGSYLARLSVEAGARDVVLPGALPQPQLNALYAKADVFCCLSEHEGFCIPLLEAMHFGLPVVARRDAAVPEVLGDAGVLLDDPDLPTVSEAIEVCATSGPLRAELAQRGRRRLEAFAPERTEAAVRSVVEAALG